MTCRKALFLAMSVLIAATAAHAFFTVQASKTLPYSCKAELSTLAGLTGVMCISAFAMGLFMGGSPDARRRPKRSNGEREAN